MIVSPVPSLHHFTNTRMKKVLLLSVAWSSSFYVAGQDLCATAPFITAGLYAVDAVNGTDVSTLNCSQSGGEALATEWYRYTSPVDTTVRISSDLAEYPFVDTRVQIYEGACGSLVCVEGDDDSGANYSSVVTFHAFANVTYTIAWDYYWSADGFHFELSEFQGPPPPVDVISFAEVSAPATGYYMAAVDMNGDHLDDAVAPTESNINIHYQLAGGGFTNTNIATSNAVNTPSWSLAAGDIDGNGYNDLLYGGGSGATFMMASDDGTAFEQHTFPEYIFCQRTNMVDINNDGNLDAFSCHDVDANVAFLNDGTGNLTFTQGGWGTTCGNYGSVWTDYDNDGDVDLFVAKCGCDPVDLLMQNHGNSAFSDVAPELGLADGHQSWSSAWGDYDNDGDMDAFIGSSSSSYHKMMLNNGDGTFTNVTDVSGVAANDGQSIEWCTHDFNNDGFLDILGGNGILVNDGDMTFTFDNSAPYNGPVGDLDNDGYLDILGGSSIHYNTGTGNNWIRIAPVGTESNRSGIGARVIVTTASGSQIRDVKSGDGFRYMSSITAHFGLGAEEAIEQVEVRWPSGRVTIIEDPAINTTLEIVEGSPSASVPETTAAQLTVYPVPATDLLSVTGTAVNNRPMRVLDVAGKVVLQGTITANALDVSGLTNGVYLLEITSPEGLLKRTFTKQ